MIKYLLLAATLLVSVATKATPVFVGQWDLYNSQGPSWSTFIVPTYSGKEAAAAIFGGLASDYVISTISSDPTAIDNMVWLDQIYVGVAKFAENYKMDSNNNGFYDVRGDSSAWVNDNACCGQYINYAFRVTNQNTVPASTPASLLLLSVSFLGLRAVRRRKYVA